MTADVPEQSGTRGRRLRLVGLWVAAVTVTGAAILVVGAPDDAEPLDPRSAGPTGLRGVVELLEGFDVEVAVDLDVPDDPDTRVFVPVDLLGAERRHELAAWVRAGGTLVVADQQSPLHDLTPVPGGLADTLGVTVREPGCDVAALSDVDAVAHGAWDLFDVPADATACFATAGGPAWLVVRPEGDGTIVALAAAEPFTNQLLDRDDNAVLAASLLGPRPGDRLVVMPRGAVGEGDTAMTDLVPDRVWDGLALLLAAVVVAALWRGRQLGPPVAEALPPVVPAAELARSVGHLLQRAGSREGAADRLRADARATVRVALGTSPTLTPERLVELAVDRLGVDATLVHTALLDAPVGDDDTLVTVSRAVHAVRRATDAPAPRGAPPTEHSQSDLSTERSIDTELEGSSHTSPDRPGDDPGAAP